MMTNESPHQPVHLIVISRLINSAAPLQLVANFCTYLIYPSITTVSFIFSALLTSDSLPAFPIRESRQSPYRSFQPPHLLASHPITAISARQNAAPLQSPRTRHAPRPIRGPRGRELRGHVPFPWDRCAFVSSLVGMVFIGDKREEWCQSGEERRGVCCRRCVLRETTLLKIVVELNGTMLFMLERLCEG